jgi:hypothetical protein
MVLTRSQAKAAADAIAWNGPMTRRKLAARNRWANESSAPVKITIEDVAAATQLMDLKSGAWDAPAAGDSIATRRPRRSCRRD